MPVAITCSRTDLVEFERTLSDALEPSGTPHALAGPVLKLAGKVQDDALSTRLKAAAAALEASSGVSEQRRLIALHAVSAVCRELNRNGLFGESSAAVDDDAYLAFLRAAVHEDQKLVCGESLSIRDIGRRARLSDPVLHAAVARAFDEGLAHVDVHEQPFALLLEHEDVEYAIAELERAVTSRASTQNSASGAPIEVDVGILTIREDEFRAVLEAFPGDRVHRARRHYNIRWAETAAGNRYQLAILRQIEQGNGEAQDAARDMIEEVRPQLLLVVGIAGGLPHDDFTLGDVVVSTRVNDYCVEARKEGEAPSYNLSGGPVPMQVAAGIANLPAMESTLGDWTSALPERPRVDAASAAVGGEANWQARVRESLVMHFASGVPRPPIFTAGILASSDRLVRDPMVLFPWIETARHILAVDMESAGVYRAARDRVPMVAIRGISDIVALKRDARWTKYACASAAAFARAYLRTEPVTPRTPPGVRNVPSATTPSISSSAAAAPTRTDQSNWLPSIAKLRTRSGVAPEPVVWQLRIDLHDPVSATRREFHDAVVDAAVEYPLHNFDRVAHFPRLLRLPGVQPKNRPDNSEHWSFAYEGEASNEAGDEQLLASPAGRVLFQRAPLWDVDEPAVDLGSLGFDTLLFLAYASRLCDRLQAVRAQVGLLLKVPSAMKGVTAIFHRIPLLPEQPDRIARLSQRKVEGALQITPTDLRGPAALRNVCKQLLDRVANEFALEPAHYATSALSFLAIDADSISKLVQSLGLG